MWWVRDGLGWGWVGGGVGFGPKVVQTDRDVQSMAVQDSVQTCTTKEYATSDVVPSIGCDEKLRQGPLHAKASPVALLCCFRTTHSNATSLRLNRQFALTLLRMSTQHVMFKLVCVICLT